MALLFAVSRSGGWAGLLALLGLGPYWLAPIMIWLTNVSRVPVWKYPDGMEGVPASVQSFFQESGRALTEMGFANEAVLNASDLAPGFSTWVAVHVHTSRTERAVLVMQVPENTLGVRSKPALYFRTKFTDGRVVETGNVSEPSPFPPLDGYDGWQFPEIASTTLICHLHRLRVAAIGEAPREPIPRDGAEAHLTAAMGDFYAAQVGTGYLRVAEPGRSFRPTAKGAILMCWKLLPPLNWLTRSRVQRRNSTFLAAHGVTK